jgi:hypothetical protein
MEQRLQQVEKQHLWRLKRLQPQTQKEHLMQTERVTRVPRKGTCDQTWGTEFNSKQWNG